MQKSEILAAIQSNTTLDWIKETLSGLLQEVNMVEYLVRYTVDDKITCECTVIAKSITHALDLMDIYIKEKNPYLKSSEILGCKFIKKIDTLLIEQP